MALNGVAAVLGSGDKFVPWIEEGALRWTKRNYVMQSRVLTYDDMSGWNTRKISEYLKYRNAQILSEDTAIPDTTLARVRKSDVAPIEIGDRYRISDRRASTDLEDIIGDTIAALGQGLGNKVETDLFATATAGFTGGTIGDGTADYTLDLPIDGQFEFSKLAQEGLIYHVVHPFQVKKVMKDLVAFSGSSAGVSLDFRNSAIQSWQLPGFGGLNIAVSSFVPRRIIHNVDIYGTGGTFKLAVGDGQSAGVNVTAAITVSGTPATMNANIKAALEALTFTGNGTWTVASTTLFDIVVTPPTTLFLNADSELRVAIDYATPSLPGRKSAFDAITGVTGSPLDVDGTALGIVVGEKSATAKALLFHRDALVLDRRAGIKAHFETVFQGRTAEYAAYMVYGVDRWRDERGMFIHTKANSAFASG